MVNLYKNKNFWKKINSIRLYFLDLIFYFYDMKIKKLEDIDILKNIFCKDENGRVVNLHELKDCQFIKNKIFYPDVLIHSHYNNYSCNPINEIVMSLEKQTLKPTINLILNSSKYKEPNPVFYFIYNTDNYFHFIYDTLPYLISYTEIKKEISNIKLLINYPNDQTKHIYKFVLEFLSLVGIDENELMFVNDETIYNNIYISSSFTHDINSNLPPRKEIYKFFSHIIESNVKNFKNNTPKKIYISRRSWVHNDYSNIGTNYTLKRKMVNEDELVNILTNNGFVEVFTENLSTIEKLNLFYNADIIVGAIGGGLCNVLFSKNKTKLISIVSPTFLDVNYRFKYSLDGVDTTYFFDTNHIENTEFKTGMRVECESKSIIGEIIKVNRETLTIIYSDSLVAGWNNQSEFKKIEIPSNLCKRLDDGLNSPFFVDLNKIKDLIF